VFYNLQIIYMQQQSYKVKPLLKTKQNENDELVKLSTDGDTAAS